MYINVNYTHTYIQTCIHTKSGVYSSHSVNIMYINACNTHMHTYIHTHMHTESGVYSSNSGSDGDYFRHWKINMSDVELYASIEKERKLQAAGQNSGQISQNDGQIRQEKTDVHTQCESEDGGLQRDVEIRLRADGIRVPNDRASTPEGALEEHSGGDTCLDDGRASTPEGADDDMGYDRASTPEGAVKDDGGDDGDVDCNRASTPEGAVKDDGGDDSNLDCDRASTPEGGFKEDLQSGEHIMDDGRASTPEVCYKEERMGDEDDEYSHRATSVGPTRG